VKAAYLTIIYCDLLTAGSVGSSQLSTFRNQYLLKVAFAGVALVDFPEFRDTYHIIPKILDWKAEYSIDYHDPEDVLSEDWEEYLWYRQLLADFLTDRTRAQSQFVGFHEYVQLAKYIWEFLLMVQVFLLLPTYHIRMFISTPLTGQTFGDIQMTKKKLR